MTGRELLSGKVAFVTGAARGIGLAIAERFVEEGASVVIGDVLGPDAEREADRLSEAGPVLGVEVDVTDEGGLERAADSTIEAFGRIDCVIANAGILVLRHAVDLGVDDWRRVIDVNLTGAFLTCKVFSQRLVLQGSGGSLVLTSSLFGLQGGVENSAYSASKFGVIGLTQCLAAELARYGITANAVCPGQIETEMLRQLFRDRAALTGKSESEVRTTLESRIPMQRLGTMREVADTYVFLASGLSRYVTGQSFVIDGGWQVG